MTGVGFAIYVGIAITDFATVKAQFSADGASLPTSIKFVSFIDTPRLVRTISISG